MLIGSDIKIIGAGVAGLSCAIALAQCGARVTVLEKSPQISEVGAGIQLSPNGVRALDRLGIPPIGIRSEAVHLLCSQSGKSLLRMPVPTKGLARDKGLAPGFWLCHRAELIEALHKRALELRVNIQLNSIVETPDELEGDIIVGADGIHSRCLDYVCQGDKPAANFTGHIAWRSIVENPSPYSHPTEARVHMGNGYHIVTYPLKEGRFTNIVAVREADHWEEEGWMREASSDDLNGAFPTLSADLKALFARTEQVYKWGLFKHKIPDTWHRGKVVILGDAVHPTLPFMAQGAMLALEDAAELSKTLNNNSNLTQGFAKFYEHRKSRCEQTVSAADRNAKLYHANGLLKMTRNLALQCAQIVAPWAPLHKYDWLYSHEIQ